MQRLLHVIGFMLCPAICLAQIPGVADATGVPTVASMQMSDVDAVNIQNGNVEINIPLYSLPQLGGLDFKFALVFNSKELSHQQQLCWDLTTPPYYYCDVYFVPSPFSGLSTTNSNIGPVPTWTRSTSSAAYSYAIPTNVSGVLLNVNAINDSNNTMHLFAEDSGSQTPGAYRAIDNSGYMITAFSPTYGNPTTWLDSDGIKSVSSTATNPTCSRNTEDYVTNSIAYPGPTCAFNDSITVSDTNGNSITRVTSYPAVTNALGNLVRGSPASSMYTDSINRSIPDPTASLVPTTTTNCPNLNASYQPVTSSALWQVPGPNGQPETFQFCYTSVRRNTNFFAGQLSDALSGSGHEDTGSYSAIQSVVLPGGSLYWGFIYDSCPAPNNSGSEPSYCYGNVTTVLYPTGGSVNYTYKTLTYNLSYLDWGIQHVSSRARNTNDGSASSVWTYTYPDTTGVLGAFVPNSTTNMLPTQLFTTYSNAWTIVTDPNQNITFYGYVPVGPSNSLANVEATRQTFQLMPSTQSLSLLQSVNTQYHVSPMSIPQQEGFSSVQSYALNANILPSQITTTLSGGGFGSSTSSSVSASQTATITYDTGFYGTMGLVPGAYQTYSWIPFGKEVSRTISDFQSNGGSVLKTLQTDYEWIDNPAFYIVNKLNLKSSEKTFDGNSNLLAETDYVYDNPNTSSSNTPSDSFSSMPPIVYGNLTSINKLLLNSGGGSAMIAGADYNAQGMVVAKIDPNYQTTRSSYITNFQYDITGIFVSESQRPTTNGYAHNDWFTYDPVTGMQTSHTDENGSAAGDPAHTTIYKYSDPLGRLTSIVSPPVASGTPETDYTYNDQANNVVTKTIQSTTTTGGTSQVVLTSTLYYDGFGRTKRTVGSGSEYVDTAYDGLGHVVSSTNPYFLGAASNATNGTTSTVYDALGRVTRICQPSSYSSSGAACAQAPNGSFSLTSYSGNQVQFQDERGNQWTSTKDGLGRTVSVVEPGGLPTLYVYDGLNSLLNVNQLGTGADISRNRTFTYDSLSRLVTASNPETGTVCYGLWRMSQATGQNQCVNGYDLNGNLLSKTDARGISTTYSYDALNRIISKVYTNDPNGTPFSCYQYDTASNGIGYLGASWTQNNASACPTSLPTTGFIASHTVVAYDPFGHVIKEKQCAPGNCTSSSGPPYVLNYSYDLAGHVTHTDDGIGQAAWFPQFDSSGRMTALSALTVWPSAFYPAQLFTVQSFWPSGAPWTWSMGGSGANAALTGTNGYDNWLRPTAETVNGHD